jgi:hypothetical protein
MPIGIVERKTADEDGVHECEHGIVHADAERQRDGCHRREPAVLEQEPDGKSDVLQEAHRHSLDGR